MYEREEIKTLLNNLVSDLRGEGWTDDEIRYILEDGTGFLVSKK